LKLVQRRGELMDEACSATDGAMAAMIGADENSARAWLQMRTSMSRTLIRPGKCTLGRAPKIEMR